MDERISVREMTCGFIDLDLVLGVIRGHPVHAVHAIQNACEFEKGWGSLKMMASPCGASRVSNPSICKPPFAIFPHPEKARTPNNIVMLRGAGLETRTRK
jgi:hypothetical protein